MEVQLDLTADDADLEPHDSSTSGKVECPICSGLFPADQVAAHASRCIGADDGAGASAGRVDPAEPTEEELIAIGNAAAAAAAVAVMVHT